MTNKAYRDGWDRVFGGNNSEDEHEQMYVNQLVKTKSFQNLPALINKHIVFQNIKKIKRIFPHIGLANCLEPFESTEELFSSNKKLYIGFSSSGATGLWDIATMSMRGVCSCMHWENSHSKQLIGSITDPFLGIVYISDNEKTKYGISFRRRALVRFVYDNRFKEFKLLIERTYVDTGNTNPHVYANKERNEDIVLAAFKKFLTAKVDKKYQVISHKERSHSENRIRSSSVDYLSYAQTSMSDCGLGFGTVHDPLVQEFANQI
jgi:hypothetical protein